MLAGTSVKPPELDEFILTQDEPLRRHELLALALHQRWPYNHPALISKETGR